MTDETTALLVLKVASRNMTLGCLSDPEQLELHRIEKIPHEWLPDSWNVGDVMSVPIGTGPVMTQVQERQPDGSFGPKVEKPLRYDLVELREKFENERYTDEMAKEALFVITPQLKKQKLKIDVAETYKEIKDPDSEIKTVTDVAHKHNVSVRTVYRYVDEILPSHERVQATV